MRIARPLSPDKKYRNYVRMQPTNSRGIMAGDVYVIVGEEIVAVCEGLKFQEIRRKILDRLLPQKFEDTSGESSATSGNELDYFEESKIKKFSETLRTILSEELQIPESGIQSSTRFARIGVDSLIALNLVSVIRSKVDKKINSGFFL